MDRTEQERRPAAIITFVWTDGLGTYQGRCQHCDWRGRWVKDEAKATAAAKDHGEEHAR